MQRASIFSSLGVRIFVLYACFGGPGFTDGGPISVARAQTGPVEDARILYESVFRELKSIKVYYVEFEETATYDHAVIDNRAAIGGDSDAQSSATTYQCNDQFRLAIKNPVELPGLAFIYIGTPAANHECVYSAYAQEAERENWQEAAQITIESLNLLLWTPCSSVGISRSFTFDELVEGYDDVAVRADLFNGEACDVIRMVNREFGVATEYFICKNPRRIGLIESTSNAARTSRRVVEWFDESFSGWKALPRVIEYTHQGPDFSHRATVRVTSALVNTPDARKKVEEMRTLARVERLKPGRQVTWKNQETFPCKRGERLIWDGKGLVCEESGIAH